MRPMSLIDKKRHMKRLLVITALGLSLVGCGKKDSGDSTAKAEGQDHGEIVEGGAKINPNPAVPGAPQPADAGGVIAAAAEGDDLFAAIAEGDLAAMRKLIADGADVNQRNAQTETPLMAAAYAGNTEALKLLIEAKADVNAKKNDGGTALLGAAFFAQPESLKALIAAGADTNVKGARGETPLSLVETPWAQMEPIYKFVRDVVKVPMDFDRIQADRPKCVAILKGEQAAPPRVNPGAGAGELFTAVAAGDLEAINKQLAAGVDVNAKEPAAGSTPLMLAAMSGQVAAAKLLIEKGADVKAKNTDGNTALHTAAFFCKAKLVTLLLEKGADVNAMNSDGETALGSVSTPWAEAKGVYELLGGLLQLQLDLKAIETARPKIAAQLREAGGK